MRRITTAILLLVGLAACGDGGTSSTGDDAQPGAPAATTVAITAVRPTTPAQSEAPFGTRFFVPDKKGRTVTVHGFKAPIVSDNQFAKPMDGTFFAAADVEQCVGPAGEAANMEGPSRIDFDVELSNNKRVHYSFMPVQEPQLIPIPLKGGECVRGWITYEVPTGATPRSVVYITGNYEALASWRIP